MNHQTPHCYLIATGMGSSGYTNTIRHAGLALAERGHRVIFVTSAGKVEATAPDANPAVYLWRSPRPTHPRDFVFLHRLIGQTKPDCLVTDGYASSNIMLLTGWWNRVACRVSWYHTLQAQLQLQYAHDRGLARLARQTLRLRKYAVWQLTRPYFVANSAAAARDISAYLGIRQPERVIDFGYLLPDPQISAVPRPQTLVCVGRLERDKSQDTLIRAVALLKADYPDLKVEFIGSGALEQTYRALAESLGVAAMCDFLGRLNHADVLAKMAASYAMVLPSLSEAYGIVNIEAFSVGTPVVASRVGGIPEIVRDGSDGLLFTPGDHHELAGKLRQILSDPDLRSRLAMSARQRFVETYDMRNVARLAHWFECIVVDSRRR